MIKDKLKRVTRILIAGIGYVVISAFIVTVVALVLKAVLVYGDLLWNLI
jgi:hypothetical protein